MASKPAAHITGVAIKLAISKDSFSIGDLQSELAQSADLEQISSILEQLEVDGWVEKDNSTALDMWRSGPLSREYGDMVTYSEDNEGTIPVVPDESDC